MAQPAGRIAAAGGQGGPPQAQQQQPGLGDTVRGVIRMAVFWYFAMKFFGPKRSTEPAQLMDNLFQRGEPLDMWLYLSKEEKFNDFSDENALVWHETNIPYAVWGPSSSRSSSFKYYPSEALKHDRSLYVHVFFARTGYPPDPTDPEYEPLSAFRRTHPVITFLPKTKADKRKNLLGHSKGSKEEESKFEFNPDVQDESEDEGPEEWVSYWKPNITINLVDDFTRYLRNNTPPHIADCI